MYDLQLIFLGPKPIFSHKMYKNLPSSYTAGKNLCIGSIAEPFHGLIKLLQVPSYVLYRLDDKGHLGTPFKGHSSSNILDFMESGKSDICRLTFSGKLMYMNIY